MYNLVRIEFRIDYLPAIHPHKVFIQWPYYILKIKEAYHQLLQTYKEKLSILLIIKAFHKIRNIRVSSI